ncbi:MULTISPECIES: response regulator transcription factor [unclassified Lebetimonas]|uniref:response regulator transcription factor n=1 Tax=unclassified Lebetimonas TaxID=2648158 RepID=UPI000466DF20|nr:MULTISPECIES: response regulator transcription factor [unclassified Lebetimonas]
MKILLVEDDEKIVSFLKRGLEEEGKKVDFALDGEEGEYLAEINNYDLIIIDWMLPKMSGIEIIEHLRKEKINTPILMLTAKGELSDKIKGFKSGADDYLTKPFEFEELLVRIEALIRRNLKTYQNILKIKDLEIDLNTKEVKKDNKIIKLTAKEYELLLFMIKNKNAYISNEKIKDELWREKEYIDNNVIAVTMYHLRKKVGDIIKNYRGLGYRLEV